MPRDPEGLMDVTLRAGQYGWDYILDFGDSGEAYIQSDHDYVPLASIFGFTGEGSEAAGEFLDDHIGDTVQVDVEDTGGAVHSWYIDAVTSLEEEEPERAGTSETPAQAPLLTKENVTWLVYAIAEDDPIEQESWADEAVIQSVQEARARGNFWPWCVAVVEGRYGSLVETTHLGCCNYRNAEDFKQNSGHYEHMRDEVLEGLNRQLAGARSSPVRTSPLVIRFMDDEMEIKLDGSLDDEEKRRLGEMSEESALGDLFENAVANGFVDKIESAGTGAPIFADPSDVERDPATGELIRCDGVFWWPNYQVESLVGTILAGGRVILPKVSVGVTDTRLRVRDGGGERTIRTPEEVLHILRVEEGPVAINQAAGVAAIQLIDRMIRERVATDWPWSEQRDAVMAAIRRWDEGGTGELVKETALPIEGEWEKDEI